ncbi:hypothetical protein ACS0X5_21205 [Burkholderia gladioli]|uniref:hypothetical protein n=1 Tax=Burkholderia gladioli TaxID=28095 RepID=UPI003F78BCCA
MITKKTMTTWFAAFLLFGGFAMSASGTAKKDSHDKAQAPIYASAPVKASTPIAAPVIPQPLLVKVQALPDGKEKSSWREPDFWLAVVTLALVVATLAVAEFTRRLANDAKESSAKTMRAYVQVSTGEFNLPLNQHSLSSDRAVAFDVRNTGQTPASAVEFWYEFETYPVGGPVPTTQTLYFPQGPRNNPPAFFPEIGAGQHFEVRHVISDPRELEMLASASSGNASVFIKGVVIYRDIFNSEDRKTFFKRVLAPNQQGLKPTVDHNSST